MILSESNVTINILADSLSLNPSTVEKNLAKLKKKQLIKRVGPDKGGHWEIINE